MRIRADNLNIGDIFVNKGTKVNTVVDFSRNDSGRIIVWVATKTGDKEVCGSTVVTKLDPQALYDAFIKRRHT